MPYRAPAEDEEAKERAKLDAEEVAAFERAIAKKSWRQRAFLFAGLSLVVATVALTAVILSVRGQHVHVDPHPGCHVAYEIHVGTGGEPATHTEILVCGDASVP